MEYMTAKEAAGNGRYRKGLCRDIVQKEELQDAENLAGHGKFPGLPQNRKTHVITTLPCLLPLFPSMG